MNRCQCADYAHHFLFYFFFGGGGGGGANTFNTETGRGLMCCGQHIGLVFHVLSAFLLLRKRRYLEIIYVGINYFVS